ncbi:hypothetical protein [Mobiluncus curtisii]|uniref:hypothetical protein n=1 Tax=Mobiluncus curtisii TaxID=2051 RepID=UPI0001E094F2|nr:hypothetical protein [Mobiluncus curtisii]EFL94286.1 hypothetical protein HMPREF0574_0608 [Mobiluncus curtisii subsp. curtisii ATCC 35241]QQT12930.1 hypothetical protein I6I84_07385 [Mobiluncus curtisii]STY77483.1 Uncharacterised protein [Mobiluncus curtisii subsp. curtisii]
MTQIPFSPNKSGRKKLADTIATHLGANPVYAGTPSFDYLIGQARLDRDWVLHLPENIDTDALSKAAITAGFAPTGKDYGLTLAFPTTGWDEATAAKLEALLAAKGELIAKALDIPATPMKMDEVEGTVEFAWFEQLPESEVIEAVSVLIQLMIEHAKTATRISPKPPASGNDKYAMRSWLLRLGMIGKGYKNARRVLLANLEGNAAWKTTPSPEDAS